LDGDAKATSLKDSKRVVYKGQGEKKEITRNTVLPKQIQQAGKRQAETGTRQNGDPTNPHRSSTRLILKPKHQRSSTVNLTQLGFNIPSCEIRNTSPPITTSIYLHHPYPSNLCSKPKTERQARTQSRNSEPLHRKADPVVLQHPSSHSRNRSSTILGPLFPPTTLIQPI
jgi:hypothetical protein